MNMYILNNKKVTNHELIIQFQKQNATCLPSPFSAHPYLSPAPSSSKYQQLRILCLSFPYILKMTLPPKHIFKNYTILDLSIFDYCADGQFWFLLSLLLTFLPTQHYVFVIYPCRCTKQVVHSCSLFTLSHYMIIPQLNCSNDGHLFPMSCYYK